MNLEPVTLEGRYVRLVPMALAHLDGLCEVGLDAELWRWTGGRIESRADMERYIGNALARQTAGTALPFVLVEPGAGKIVGSSRFGSIDAAHKRVEIGWSWVARPWQRTGVNTEAKYLMLRHAFETLGCVRVELKTDALNEASRRAIERIGATREGVLRQHMIAPGGRLRDSVYFSILDHEWPDRKARLEAMLAYELLRGIDPGRGGGGSLGS